MLAKVTGLLQAMQRRRMAPPRLDQLRLAGLRAVLRQAMERVPFYRTLYREAGIRIEDIRSLADIRLLPVIDKRDLRNAGMAATADGGAAKEGWLRFHTSGTTGEPLSVWLSEQERRRRLLREFRALLSLGFRPSDRLAILGPEGAGPRGWHERLGFFRPLIIPASLPNAERLRLLSDFRPAILWAYPTTLHEVAEEAGWRLSAFIRPRTLITSAQFFRPAFRNRVLADLGAEHFVMYAANEVGRIGVECSLHHGLHIEADALIVEIQQGQVVVTSLENFTMPVIRYRLGDLSAWEEGPCRCGCGFPRIQTPHGRDIEMLRMPSGRHVSVAALDYALRGADWIDQYQYIQHAAGRLEVLLATRRTLDNATTAGLRRKLADCLPEPIDVTVRLVEEIPRDGAKFQVVLSRLQPETTSRPD
jgi:phenylacetate-CoA ligase